MSAGVSAPAARRRPRDRKQQILAAAAGQFWTLGYHQVSMADIATEVGIAPSAFYRHFRGKQELLLAIFDDHLRLLEELTAAPGGDLVADFAAFALEHREFGVLWEREAGHLPADQQQAIRRRLRALAGAFAAGAAAAMPGPQAADLRSWAALSVLDSPSHHRTQIDRARFGELLQAAAHAVLAAPLPDLPGPPGQPGQPAAVADRGAGPGLVPASRREALLAVAIRLFSERGYPSVGLADIGAAAGIAGPSVYKHFDSKTGILAAALNRGNEALWLGLHHALAAAAGPADAVDRVAADYAAFTAANTGIVRILVSELIHLPEERRLAFRRAELDYITEWVTLLTAARPGLTGADARVLVQAALAMINSLARIPHLRIVPGRTAQLSALAQAVLAAGEPAPAPPAPA